MAGWVAGAIVGSALIGAAGSSSAASTAAASSDKAAELQYQQYKDEVARQKPFYDVGTRALSELEAASRYAPFDMATFAADPGLAYRRKMGLNALQNSAAARGGLISGKTYKDLERFGQEFGTQEYMNAFNRYQTERTARLNPLQSLAGYGQTAANTLGDAGRSYASGAGNAYMAGGRARASGYIGGANAVTGAVGSGLGYYQQNQLLNAMRPSYGPSFAADPYGNIG